MFHKILIANRGEIALRIMRSCRELGIRTVVAHSKADTHSLPVILSDESICIGPDDPRASYLNIPAIISAVALTEAEAIHPALRPLRLSALMLEIGKEWTDISRLFKEESEKERPESFASIAGRVRAQADREQKLYDSILKHVG